MRGAPWIALTLALAACGPPPAPPAGPPLPTDAQIRSDLDGQRFAFYDDDDGAREWTVEAGEVRALRVVDSLRTADRDGLRLRVAVVLAAPGRTIRGDLVLDYAWDGAAWGLRSLDRAGPNFDAGDRTATLYDARLVADSTGRWLTVEPIATYDDGAWETLLDGEDAALEQVYRADRPDSLRQRDVAALEGRVRERWVPDGLPVRLLATGRPPLATRLDSAFVTLDGCQSVGAWAAAPPGARDGIATTSTVMGGAVGPGRAPTGTEERAVGRLARQRLAALGLDASRVRASRLVAADLDGDGTVEIVGTFTVDDDEGGRGVALAARVRSDGAHAVFERGPDAGHTRFELVGIVDVDADGGLEVVLREAGYESFGYRIVSPRAGRFADVFRGGGGGC